MTRLVLVLAVGLLIVPLAGCLGNDATHLSGSAKAKGVRTLGARALAQDLLADGRLWTDSQNFPHPAFGWPTLSSPATGDGLPAHWAPIAPKALPDPIKSIKLLSKSPAEVKSGAGIAMFGSLAVVPGYGKDSAVVDVSDPAHPKTLGLFKPQEGMASHRGATIIAYPNGRLVTVISTGTGLDAWDITDPTHPEAASTVKIRSHKVGVVPGTPIVYNAASRGGGQGGQVQSQATGITEIYDYTDPMNPVKVKDFANGYSCHHVYFWNSKDKQRAICAGVQYAQIWDTKDPRDPKVIVSVPIFSGVRGAPSTSVGPLPWAHYAGLSNDGKILLVGDENGGGSSPPGCVASVNTPQGAVSTPVGALWFYDVSTETSPKVLGWYSPLNDPRMKPTPTTSCTAHHGRMVPAAGKNMIAMSFYGAGVVLIDYTGVGTPGGPLPKVVSQFADGSDTWETWYNQGYLFTGDLARGMDTIAFE
jgi:hypothetical protein